MRPIVAVLMLICVFGSAKGQNSRADANAAASRVTLELGSVTVWLGMPKADVLAQFQGAGYRITGQDDARTVSIGNSPAMIGFKNGRLKYATREWYTSGQDEMEVVIRALTDLESHGGSPCSIVPSRVNTPEGSSDQVFVDCGERSLMFVRGKVINGKSGEDSFVEVQERIGLR